MNRRDFIKSLGLVGAGVATGVGVTVLANEDIKPIEFEKATFKRGWLNDWHLEFVSPKVLNPDKESGLVIEIGDKRFFLKNWQDITFTTEYNRDGSQSVTHHLSGDGYEEL